MRMIFLMDIWLRLKIGILSKITEYIEKHVDSENLSLEEVAEYMQVSVRTLYRRFKEMDLESPKDYIKEYRINLAAKLLRTTSLTVQEIMYKTGFANRSHFYKNSLNIFQVTPKDYRNKYNKEGNQKLYNVYITKTVRDFI